MTEYGSRILKRTVTMILAGGEGSRLYPLTTVRSKPSVPFGGHYRIIDFTLSNCINSGFRRIYLLTQYKSQSLDEHLHLGWSIFSPELGEFLYTVPPQRRRRDRWYEGTADAIFQNINLLSNHPTDYVLILSGDHIYKMDYSTMLANHLENKAHLTVSTMEVSKDEATRLGVCEVDENMRIVGFHEKSANPPEVPGKPGICLASMGVYIFNTDPLVLALSKDMKTASDHDFGKNIIPGMINDYRVFAYPFKDENQKEKSYWQDIGTLDSYYDASMDLVSVSPAFDLYNDEWPIRTALPQKPPAKTVWTGEKRSGLVLESLVSNGAIVSGGKVLRSIIGPGVKVNSFSEVTESILFAGTSIGRHAKIKNTIIDKDVHVPEGTTIGYDIEEDRKRFVLSDGGVIVIPKGYKF